MARASTAEVREHLDLFGWARQEALRIEEARAEQARRVKAKQEAEEALQGTAEWQAMDKARRALVDAKKTALEEDLVVGEAAAALKAARKMVKGLRHARDLKLASDAAKVGEDSIRASEADLSTALARGEVPSVRSQGGDEATVELIGPDGKSTGPLPMDAFGTAARALRGSGGRPS